MPDKSLRIDSRRRVRPGAIRQRWRARLFFAALTPFVVFPSASHLCAQEGGGVAVADRVDQTDTAAEKKELAKLNLDSYQQVWQTIKDTHWDPELGGLDWEACREAFQPTVEDAEDTDKVRAAMSRLIAKLEKSHFVIIPKILYGAEEKQKETGSGWSGIDYRLTGEGSIIVKVVADSPASQVGLRPGQRIVAIDDEPVLAPQKLVEDEGIAERIAFEIVFAKTAASLSGPVGAERKITVEDIDGSQRDLSVTLADEPGDLVAFGNLPKMNLQIETKMLDGNIGYIRLSIFLDPSRVMEKISQFVKDHPAASGMIIDIRGNPGGIGAMAGGIAGWFSASEQQPLGTMILRNGTFKLIAFRQSGAFEGPIAVLVDDRSASTSEIFASGMQKSGRARIFGRTTAGAALPSMIEILPNGDRFLHAFAALNDLDGNSIEGIGVIPDQTIPLDREQLATGNDIDLTAAVRWIASEKASSERPSPKD